MLSRPFLDFPDDVGIGDVGARHAYEIHDGFGDGVPRGRDLGDAAGMYQRQLDMLAELPDLVQPGRER